MKYQIIKLGLATFIVGLTIPAQAAIVTLSFNLKAYNFASDGTVNPVPVEPVTGHFFVRFDNSQSIGPTYSQIVVTGLNIPYDQVPEFTYLSSSDHNDRHADDARRVVSARSRRQ